MDAMTAIDYLRRIPFALFALEALCDKSDLCKREARHRIYRAVSADIEQAIAMIENEGKK